MHSNNLTPRPRNHKTCFRARSGGARMASNSQLSASSSGRRMSQLAGVKRRVTQAAIADSIKLSQKRRLMAELTQETNGSQFWSMKAADNFVNTKTQEVNARPTELSNDELLFQARSGDKYMHVNSIKFLFDVKLQKKDDGVWKNLGANDKVCVLPGSVMNLLRENLEVRMVHPGEAEDTTVINVKQDERRYLTRYEIQRTFDKLFCEKELKDDMQIVKEFTYNFLNADTSSDDHKPGKPLAAFGKRAKNVDIDFQNDSILKICQEFGNELKTGKKFTIEGAVMDPFFTTPLLPPHHGLNISMKLGREEDHARYIEDYTKLATATDPDIQYRFIIQKTGAHKVKCRYDTSTLTTSAMARYNEQFENNRSVDVATFMVYKVDHRNIEQGSTEYLDLKFPNTSDMPCLATLQMMHRDDFNHDSNRANYFSNVFLNFVKQIKFNSASDLNPTYQDGVSMIDLNEDIDKEGAYKSQRRFMMGRENVNMSDLLPANTVLNGASNEIYANEGESKASFMKIETGRHLTPFVIEMDPSHGKYGPDQKQTNMSNTEVSMNFIFHKALPHPCVLILTCGYRGKYIQKRLTNGALSMSFQNVDIPSTLL